ncbi:hypothetical protein [Actinomadura sp. 9N407]|uniref:hypothetical protein n=1 Tax=Actinomadura sp. 9N407 TaxID=3375154 RepID=UPI0037913634
MNVQAILVRGGAGITGTALLATAMWLYTLRPDVRAKELEPIRTGGEIGAVVTTPDFRLRVERVDAARSLSSTLGNPERTEGIFLIVRFRASSQKEPIKLQSIVLETPGGYSFRPAPRLGTSSASIPEFQPMIWTKSAHVFELPQQAAAGAKLVVGTGGLLPQLSSAVEVDLGLTDAKVEAAAEAYDLRGGRP